MAKKELRFLSTTLVKRPDLWAEEFNNYILDIEALCEPGHGGEVKPDGDWKWWIETWHLAAAQEKGCADIAVPAIPVYPSFGELDPIEILQVFCLCQDLRVYPPAWVMNDLYKRLGAYLDDNMSGRARRLGEYFGEPRNGNRRNIFKGLAFRKMMDTACLNVFYLERIFSKKQNQALDIIALKVELIQEDLPKGWKGIEKTMGREALRKAYQTWKSGLDAQRTFKFFETSPPTPEDRINILQSLGRDCLAGHPDLIAFLDIGKKQGTKN